MDVLAKIIGVKYIPFLCPSMTQYSIAEIDSAFNKDATFIL